jgi:hypothetical protein
MNLPSQIQMLARGVQYLKLHTHSNLTLCSRRTQHAEARPESNALVDTAILHCDAEWLLFVLDAGVWINVWNLRLLATRSLFNQWS